MASGIPSTGKTAESVQTVPRPQVIILGSEPSVQRFLQAFNQQTSSIQKFSCYVCTEKFDLEDYSVQKCQKCRAAICSQDCRDVHRSLSHKS